MNLDLAQFVDKGFTAFVAFATAYIVFSTWKMATKYVPDLLKQFTAFIGVWHNFTDALENNAEAIDRNTEITDLSHRHANTLLMELKLVNDKFTDHDCNAQEIKEIVTDLLVMIQESDKNTEVLGLLKQIIVKLELEETSK